MRGYSELEICTHAHVALSNLPPVGLSNQSLRPIQLNPPAIVVSKNDLVHSGHPQYVASSVGESDGDEVGESLGAFEIVGVSLGAGEVVGFGVAAAVGFADGFWVGGLVGALEGLALGGRV